MSAYTYQSTLKLACKARRTDDGSVDVSNAPLSNKLIKKATVDRAIYNQLLIGAGPSDTIDLTAIYDGLGDGPITLTHVYAITIKVLGSRSCFIYGNFWGTLGAGSLPTINGDGGVYHFEWPDGEVVTNTSKDTLGFNCGVGADNAVDVWIAGRVA